MLNLTSNNQNRFLASQSKYFFYNLYIKDKLSIYKIGIILKATPQCIYQYLKRHNIKLRSLSECHKGSVSGFKGKKHTKEAKLKNKLSHLKDNHKERNNYYPSIFYQIKDDIKKRDNYKCKCCGLTEEEHIFKLGHGLNVHHIDYNKENCTEYNLITTCHSCNSKANFNRDYWFAYYTYIMDNYIKGETKCH